MSWLLLVACLFTRDYHLLFTYKILMFLVVACCDGILGTRGGYNASGKSRQEERDASTRTALLWVIGVFIAFELVRMRGGM